MTRTYKRLSEAPITALILDDRERKFITGDHAGNIMVHAVVMLDMAGRPLPQDLHCLKCRFVCFIVSKLTCERLCHVDNTYNVVH